MEARCRAVLQAEGFQLCASVLGPSPTTRVFRRVECVGAHRDKLEGLSSENGEAEAQTAAWRAGSIRGNLGQYCPDCWS